MKNIDFDAIIIGGSYAGLSAAMTLGRSLRKVLVIDSADPCNAQTPHSHNVITLDGEKPAAIAAKAKAQVLNYPTVTFLTEVATQAVKTGNSFEISTKNNGTFLAKKLLFATGIKDVAPKINGFSDCWGISILHCPYCHGYEVHDQKIGLLGNGDTGFEICKLLSNWSKHLALFTNGKSTLTTEQKSNLTSHNIPIVEQEILDFGHQNGYLNQINFKDGSVYTLDAIFSRVPFTQKCDLPEQLNAELTELGYIKVDDFQRTTIPGVYAAGDNQTMFRSVAVALASGSKAGAFINKELIDEQF